MKDLFKLIEKLISKEITSEESLKLHQLCDKYQIDEETFVSYYLRKWEEAFNSKEDIYKKEKIWKSIERELNQSHSKLTPVLNLKWLKATAAVLLLLLFTGIGLHIYNSKSASQLKNFTVIAENGQKSKLELPDGTLVWLNSESKISYNSDYGKKNRTLNLIGEAYFEVKKELNKPFIVQTLHGVNVKALGTKFNVKSYENDEFISSTLFEGKIEVSNEMYSATLNPNEEIIVNKKNGIFTESKIENQEDKLFWIGKNLRFKDETLGNIVKTLERMYEVEFHFETAELQDIKYSGEIKNTELKNVINLISIVSPVEFDSNNADILIKKKHKK